VLDLLGRNDREEYCGRLSTMIAMKPFAYDSGSPFDLRTSPFYVFSVSPGDDRVAIEDAKETAISDGRLSEVQALRLEQLLMAPRPRLGAELAWLLGVVPNRVRKLIDEISLVAEDAADLPPLAAANIAAHRCAQNLAPVHADLLVSFYALNDEEETLSLLNLERRKSGLPEVPRELMQEALRELMHAPIRPHYSFSLRVSSIPGVCFSKCCKSISSMGQTSSRFLMNW